MVLHSSTTAWWELARITIEYWRCLLAFTLFRQEYASCVYFVDDTHARVQIFSLSLIFKLWSESHYRSKDFQEDLLNNLKNVAVPGTGIALSWFCYSKVTAYLFVLLCNPMLCLLGAIHQVNSAMTRVDAMRSLSSASSTAAAEVLADIVNEDERDSVTAHVIQQLIHLFQHVQNASFYSQLIDQYVHNLLHPDDWFSLWRMNCRLVSYHSAITHSEHYRMEDKWTFLTEGHALQVPVSPFITDMEAIVCKNKLIEGGMGIHFYRNAAHGGDWILQEKLKNADWLSALLPHNAPLSTMRIITTSSYSLSSSAAANGSNSDEHNSTTSSTKSPSAEEDISHSASHKELQEAMKFVRAESAVLRLGRMNASTDHSSILFDVDIHSGIIRKGTTNAHWYQLGADKPFTTTWLPPRSDIVKHIDYPFPLVAGKTVPDMQSAVDIVVRSHYKMMPEVPVVGWDVAFTPQGIFLLEVNLSCNFFRGSFDLPRYISFVDSFWQQLQKMERLNIEQKTPIHARSQTKYKRGGSSKSPKEE